MIAIAGGVNGIILGMGRLVLHAVISEHCWQVKLVVILLAWALLTECLLCLISNCLTIIQLIMLLEESVLLEWVLGELELIIGRPVTAPHLHVCSWAQMLCC